MAHRQSVQCGRKYPAMLDAQEQLQMSIAKSALPQVLESNSRSTADPLAGNQCAGSRYLIVPRHEPDTHASLPKDFISGLQVWQGR